MKKKFSVEQIAGVSKQAEVGVPVAELIRKTGITEQTYSDGRRFRSLTEVDIYTRESLAIESGQSLRGEDVVRALKLPSRGSMGPS